MDKVILIIVAILCFSFCGFIISFLLFNRKSTIEKINKGNLDASIIFDDHKHKIQAKKYKGLKIATNVFVDLVLVVLALFLLFGLSDRFLNTSITGYKSLVVPTDSMSYKNEANPYLEENNLNNQIQPNDLVFIKTVDNFEDVQLYDVICYKNELDIQIIHRVVEIHEDYFKTRGDAETLTDTMNITFDRVVGRYTNVRIPVVGNIIFFISSYYGLIAMTTIFVMLLAYWLIKDSTNKYETNRLKYLLEQIGNNFNFEISAKEGKLIANGDDYQINKIDEKLQVEGNTTLKVENTEIVILKSEGESEENEKETHK